MMFLYRRGNTGGERRATRAGGWPDAEPRPISLAAAHAGKIAGRRQSMSGEAWLSWRSSCWIRRSSVERVARYLLKRLAGRSGRRDQVLSARDASRRRRCAIATEICRCALATGDRRRHAASRSGCITGWTAECTMTVGVFASASTCVGGRRGAGRSDAVVAGVAADHHAAGRRIDAIATLSGNVVERMALTFTSPATRRSAVRSSARTSGRWRAPQVRLPDGACPPRSLRDLAGMDQRVGDMGDEFSQLIVKPQRRATSSLHTTSIFGLVGKMCQRCMQVDEAFAVVVVHVGEEDGVHLRRQRR